MKEMFSASDEVEMLREKLRDLHEEHAEMAQVLGGIATEKERLRKASWNLLRVLDRFDNAPVSASDAIDELRAAMSSEAKVA